MIADRCASYVQHCMQIKTGACCLGALMRNDPSGLSIAIGLCLSVSKATSCKSQRLIKYGQTSGVIVQANSNRLKIKESVYATNKSKARKVPAPEIAKPPGKTPLCFQCLFIDLYVLFKNYGVVQKDNQ